MSDKKNPALIFDFDGTLVDSMPAWSKKMTDILDRAGVVYPENIIEIITPLGDIGTANYFIENFGIQATVPELIAEMDAYALPRYENEIPLKESVYETLHELRARGYSLNVLTASPHRMLDPCLVRNGVFSLFDHVWSCEDFRTTKADPAIYHAAAAALGRTASECLFFDDNLNAVKTAALAGMPAYGVYDDTSKGLRREITEAASGRYAVLLSELLGTLL